MGQCYKNCNCWANEGFDSLLWIIDEYVAEYLKSESSLFMNFEAQMSQLRYNYFTSVFILKKGKDSGKSFLSGDRGIYFCVANFNSWQTKDADAFHT